MGKRITSAVIHSGYHSKNPDGYAAANPITISGLKFFRYYILQLKDKP